MTTHDTPDAALGAALAEYRANPIDARDAERSWRALGALLDACDDVLWTGSTCKDADVLRAQRDLLANAVVHVIGRPGRPGECPICRGAEPCEADEPAIQLAAGMFAGASEAELAASVDAEREGHRICEENMDAEIARLTAALQLLGDPNHHIRPVERESIARFALAPSEP